MSFYSVQKESFLIKIIFGRQIIFILYMFYFMLFYCLLFTTGASKFN